MTRLEKLKELEKDLKSLMEKANSRSYAALCKQYRDTLREIEALEGRETDGDTIKELLAEREANGKPGAVRKDRAKVQRK